MAIKLKQWQRDELLRVHQRDGLERSRALAIEYGVSENYGAVLNDRAHGGRGRPSKRVERAWERAVAIGPIGSKEP